MQPADLDAVGPLVPAALLAIEDHRFYWHPGVDPIGIARAALQLVRHRRIVSGGSTLTQQLARTLVPRPRTLGGKIREAALAVRIELSLSKREILAEYLTRVPFGPSVRGVEAASRSLFDRPAGQLSLAEAALLAGLPQGPSVLDPRRSLDRARQRRDRVLDRLVATSAVLPEQAERARHEPISLTHWRPEPLAPHLIQSLLAGPLSPGPAAEITSTLDATLQRAAEQSTRRIVQQLQARAVSAAAVVVLDNASGEILAYVGSPSVHDARHLGANDGVRARRQPGSSLKPFVYQLALERLGWTAATLLPDVAIRFPGLDGAFVPHNYDGKLHGPVRLREALASSLNLPAVWTASQLGPASVLDRLHDLGFASLDQPPAHYGVALALGDGEVTLLELARAYLTLARGGTSVSPRAVRSFRTWDGQDRVPPPPVPTRVLDGPASALIVDILADPGARLASFGADSWLDFPFPVAAKTGTSKGFRDNLAVGATREVTVAVWVGNFDGRPMEGVSGITGAGPLFHEVMLAAMERRAPAPLVTADFTTRAICALSGAPAGPDCPHVIDERFLPVPGASPDAPCTMHRRLPIDPTNGLLAGPGCPDARLTLVEDFPPRYLPWATAAHRPLAPTAASPRCPSGAPLALAASPPRLVAPADGATLLLDPGHAGPQALTVRMEAPGVREVVVEIDAERHVVRGPPFELRWPLRPGRHTLRATAAGLASDEQSFEVLAP